MGDPADIIIELSSGDEADNPPQVPCLSTARTDAELLKELRMGEQQRIQSSLLVADLSSGQEKYSIPVYNEETFDDIDLNFKYVVSCIRRKEHRGNECYCSCPAESDCSTNDCECFARSTIKLKDHKIKNVKEVVAEPMDLVLVECRPNCGCKKRCNNWLTHLSVPFRTEVHYFEGKGFGIRFKDYAKKGDFFCEYIGEFIHEEERTDLAYQYAIEAVTGDKEHSFIDARVYGNLSRFLNHSCNPCLSPFLFVRSRYSSLKYPQLGFFFNRAAVPDQELSIYYGDGYWKNVDFDCRCGFAECIKPHINARYRTDEEYARAVRAEKAEHEMNTKLVQEKQLCDQRLKLLQEGKTKEEALAAAPNRKSRRRRKEVYVREDRCHSPMVPGQPINLSDDDDS